MVRIDQTGINGPGLTWKFTFNKKEVDDTKCEICKGKIKHGDMIYICEECKKYIHEECHKKHISKNKYPCFHSLKEEWQYYYGAVVRDE